MRSLATISVGVGGTVLTFSYRDFVGGLGGTLTCIFVSLQIYDWFKKRRAK